MLPGECMRKALLRRFLNLPCTTLILGAFALAAAVDENDDDAQNAAEKGGEVEVQSAIVNPGHKLTFKAEFNLDVEDDDPEDGAAEGNAEYRRRRRRDKTTRKPTRNGRRGAIEWGDVHS